MNRLLSLVLLSLTMVGALAQDNVILSIENQQFSVDEFNYIFEKNNALTQEPVSKNEYVDLFVNYKLKVAEAMAQGYDTLSSFKQELNYYRDELAKPYLNDKKATEEVVEEAYQHMLYEIEASHILIKLPKSPSPKDTLEAYNKVAKIKSQLSKGKDFKQMAIEFSEGPSGKNGGHLGYFGAFMMVYPFEKAAYNTPVGEVSDITRTSFGYHLIKVHNKRKNQGEILVAHIMKAFPYQANEQIQNQSKIAIDSIHRKLMNGESFDEMVAQFSDDKQTVANKGQLPWFGSGRMVPEFSDAAFGLAKDGDISQPVKTQFGWHIIQRLDSRPVKPIDECKDEIMQKIKRDERAFAGKKATVERLKNEYNYTVNANDYQQLTQIVVKNSQLEKEAFIKKINDASLKVASFADVVFDSEKIANEAFPFNLPEKGLSDADFQQVWDAYVEDELLAYEKSQLEAKYPEFKFLMNEYHDGLLIFEISQKEIWNKASNDSIGLASFYEHNSSNYILDEHFEGQLYYCKSKKVLKQLKKALKKQPELVLDSLSAELKDNILLKEGRFFKGDEVQLDAQIWKEKASVINVNYPYLFTQGTKVAESTQMLDEVRGRVISDYQEQLEKEWINSLHEKFKPEVNTFVIK
ncbi:peptidylprolyl isomerase [Carboxylicivirga sp. M1479]|uniref:peptidylprolyl isomerase n=1 Tax=Carboxylicivirga sp. M1479 TaxID=2594476 RepID=UPI001178B06E|nr:peptidylprolyl isomerase [Carboxylicivirga sp. M1479]TRX62512.1 hypothetical protein FNN09_19590 [Carboxylicivirga sp. M1479]